MDPGEYYASSAVFVWDRGLWKVPKRMIQSGFKHVTGPVAKAAASETRSLLFNPSTTPLLC